MLHLSNSNAHAHEKETVDDHQVKPLLLLFFSLMLLLLLFFLPLLVAGRHRHRGCRNHLLGRGIVGSGLWAVVRGCPKWWYVGKVKFKSGPLGFRARETGSVRPRNQATTQGW